MKKHKNKKEQEGPPDYASGYGGPPQGPPSNQGGMMDQLGGFFNKR